MPRAKREKVISLTDTKKKTKEGKQNLVQKIRSALDEYERVYVVEYDNVPSSEFIKVRQQFKQDSQFFLGKKSLMSFALGRTKEEEIANDLHVLSMNLVMGDKRGLLFTNKTHASVLKKKDELMVNPLGYWSKKKGYHEI
ncbi:Ribosome assembly factor mrt4 [Aphelenchoides bicaudatus]|nr:Ribosome assembly factor mrt4 [Aphelenchoides bicaudatus]